LREARPSSLGTPPGGRLPGMVDSTHPLSGTRAVHSRRQLFANAAIADSRVACSSISGLNF